MTFYQLVSTTFHLINETVICLRFPAQGYEKKPLITSPKVNYIKFHLTLIMYKNTNTSI